jgi:tRNA(Ile)-lysidine synthase
VRAERAGARLVLIQRVGRGVKPSGNTFRYALSIPGEVWLPEAGCVIAAELVPPAELPGPGADDKTVAVAAGGGKVGLTVRGRRPGDVFRPSGGSGRKKLQDYFVDRKIVRELRDRIPLVVDDHDRIIWVAGHAISEEFRVTDKAQAVLILRLKDPAEAGAHPPAKASGVGGQA